MSDETGKWFLYNKDGSSHDCRTSTSATSISTETIDITGQKAQKEPTIEQLKIWIARLEKVGVKIDINEILNPKKEQQK